MRSTLTLFAALALLSGCFGNSSRQAEPAHFDLGAAAIDLPQGPGVSAVEVSAPSWLAGSAMQYRLSHAEPARRFDYADSRWVAPPAELLGKNLERRLASVEAGRCRLNIELDELIQIFDSPELSRVTLAGRASLLGNTDVLARRSFAFAPTAPTADAKGGVVAAAIAVKALGDEMAAWVAQIERCRKEQ